MTAHPAWYKYPRPIPPPERNRAGGTTSPDALPIAALPYQAAAPATPIVFWLLLLGLYIASFLVGLWVYQDARLRRMRGPFWFAVSFGVPIFGFVGYLIFRRERAA